MNRRRWLALALLCLGGAVAGIAYGVKLERDALADRDAAVANGVTRPARVLGSLRDRQGHVRVRFVVDDVEHRVSVFPDRAYFDGVMIDVAHLPEAPDRIFIVGATPWNWWTAKRSLFVIAAVVAGLVAIGTFVFVGQPTRTSSV